MKKELYFLGLFMLVVIILSNGSFVKSVVFISVLQCGKWGINSPIGLFESLCAINGK